MEGNKVEISMNMGQMSMRELQVYNDEHNVLDAEYQRVSDDKGISISDMEEIAEEGK